MPYSAEHKSQTRERIIIAARRLFNGRGFTEVSIDEIMEKAGLTRGGFYNHFGSKEELYAEAITAIFRDHPAENWEDADFDFSVSGPALARVIIESYLSDQHLEDVEGSCPMIALPSDVSRGGDAVKSAYSQVLESMVGIFQANLNNGAHDPRQMALAIAVLNVGGMVLARAVDNRALADEIRTAARDMALGTGGWQE